MKTTSITDAFLISQEVLRAEQQLVLARAQMAKHLLWSGFQPISITCWLGLLETKPVLATRLMSSRLKARQLERIRAVLPGLLEAHLRFKNLRNQVTCLVPILNLN